MFVRGNDIKLGSADKPAFVNESAASTLHLGYGTYWDWIVAHVNTGFKVFGAIQADQGFKARDGSQGVVSGNIDVLAADGTTQVRIVVRDGLITGYYPI